MNQNHGNRYLPEGSLLTTPENRLSLSGVDAIRSAMAEGRILEAPAIRATADFDLQVDLGPHAQGVIPREESVFLYPGEHFKEIAVIGKVGKAVCFRIIGEEKGENGIPRFLLSRRAAQLEAKLEYLDCLEPGDIIDCRVTHSERYGAFCDVACGNFALLPIDCISVSRLPHPSERFHPGDVLRVAVKNRDSTGRLFITRRELCGTWAENAALFSPGQTVTGIVRSIEDYGVFIELTPNLAGLAEPCEDLTVGQTASVYIKSMIPEKAKVKLVIVDKHPGLSCTCPVPPFPIEQLTHIEEWHYSPAGCRKRVDTIFSAFR